LFQNAALRLLLLVKEISQTQEVNLLEKMKTFRILQRPLLPHLAVDPISATGVQYWRTLHQFQVK
ncbi:unnamed protein product, partial [Timema podura]|nr:unnamed protein product [Timema podura]